jgi:hypothetical protein
MLKGGDEMNDQTILEYDETGAEKWRGVFDVCTPQECADIFQKPVRNGNIIYYPNTSK